MMVADLKLFASLTLSGNNSFCFKKKAERRESLPRQDIGELVFFDFKP
jgi:hypothetical protein